jgi:hypothetical protein
MTGYSAVLLVVFVSPGTGSTSTFTDVCSPNGTSAPTVNTTAFVSPASMIGMEAVLTIGSGCFGIVASHDRPPGSPVSSTRPRPQLVVTLMVVSVSSRGAAVGSASVAIRFRGARSACHPSRP